jgi:thiaminase
MAALLLCSWSYVEIAAALRERVDTMHPIYGGWIAYFSKPEVVQMVGEMRQDFDELTIHEATSDQRWRDIAHVFATSSRLERGPG